MANLPNEAVTNNRPVRQVRVVLGLFLALALILPPTTFAEAHTEYAKLP